MRTWIPLALAALLSAASCSTPKSPPEQTSAPGGRMMAGRGPGAGQGRMAGSDDACPMQLSGAAVVPEDVDGGAAVRFTTSGDVEELRRRVAARAARHTEMHARPGMGMGMGRGAAGTEMRAATVTVENVDGGARLVYAPSDPARLDALRAEVREHAQVLASRRDCPMFGRGTL